MKRWQIVLILFVVLGLIGGLELNIYFRENPRTLKKILLAPRVAKKTTLKKAQQLKKYLVRFGANVKSQYSGVTTNAVALKRSSGASQLLRNILLGLGGLIGFSALLFLIRRRLFSINKSRASRKLDVLADDGLPPLPEHKDPEIHADKIAEVLRARRSLQGSREGGRLSPLGEQQIRKYELTEAVVNYEGRILRRIRALTRIQNKDGDIIVEQGELGGYIEHEANLSHYRNAWVAEQALVCGNAKVYGDALVAGQAKIFDKARIYDLARIDGVTVVGGTAEMCGKIHVSQGTFFEGKKAS
jgi:hypothetical protein